MPRPLIDFIHWIGFSRILASAFGVVVMVVGVWWVVRVPPPPPEASIPFATTSVASNTGETSALPSSVNIMVYVSGEVVKPGVYVLLATARVIDALQAAQQITLISLWSILLHHLWTLQKCLFREWAQHLV